MEPPLDFVASLRDRSDARPKRDRRAVERFRPCGVAGMVGLLLPPVPEHPDENRLPFLVDEGVGTAVETAFLEFTSHVCTASLETILAGRVRCRRARIVPARGAQR
jgi:hypothetical protein